MKTIKINKTIGYIVMLLITVLAFNTKVFAATTKPADAKVSNFLYDPIKIGGHAYYKHYTNGSKKEWSGYQLRFLRYDGHAVYCIDFGADTGRNDISKYTAKSFKEILESAGSTNVEEDYNRVNLIAYYGYEYKGRAATGDAKKKYYVAAQAMIWEYLDSKGWFSKVNFDNKEMDFYYDKSATASHKLDISAERAEITDLINKHFTKPSICNMNYELTIEAGSESATKSYEDVNGVLGGFTVSGNCTSNIQVNGNTMTITGKKAGSCEVKLNKGATVEGDIAYTWNPGGSYQRIFDLPVVPAVECTLNYTVAKLENPQTGSSEIYIFIGVSLLALVTSIALYNSDKIKAKFKK